MKRVVVCTQNCSKFFRKRLKGWVFEFLGYLLWVSQYLWVIENFIDIFITFLVEQQWIRYWLSRRYDKKNEWFFDVLLMQLNHTVANSYLNSQIYFHELSSKVLLMTWNVLITCFMLFKGCKVIFCFRLNKNCFFLF